jgi:hypothetical protein
MRKLVLVLVLATIVQTGFCQEFTNQLWIKPASSSSTIRLDYFSNWQTITGEKRTTVYFSHLACGGAPFHAISGCSTIRIRDKATGKEYKVINGNGITLRKDAVFAFHSSSREIGFSLDFELIPSTVRNIDIMWGASKWFADVQLDPAKNYESPVFRLNYMLRTLSFYTRVNKVITFRLENSIQSDLVLRQYYESSNKPADCTAAATLTLAFAIEEQDQPYNVYAYYTIGDRERHWQFTATPGTGCDMISLEGEK